MVKDVIDTAINALDDFELKTFPDRVIALPTGNVSTLNFSLSQADKDFLYESGYDSAKAFFSTDPAGKNRFGKAAGDHRHQQRWRQASPGGRRLCLSGPDLPGVRPTSTSS